MWNKWSYPQFIALYTPFLWNNMRFNHFFARFALLWFFWVCVLSTRYSAFFLIAPKRLNFAFFSLNFKIFYIYTHFFNTSPYLTLIFNEISNQRKRKLHLSYSPCFFLFLFNPQLLTCFLLLFYLKSPQSFSRNKSTQKASNIASLFHDSKCR